MKRTLSTIALAVLTVGLLGSCSKINERLDNLDKRVDGIENEKIATINGQIDGIKNSIKDLDQIRGDISGLKQSAENHGQDIFDLQEADETLGNRIDNLEDYLKNVLPNYAEKEWVKATYSTLEQYDSTCTAIAEINAKIGELDTKLTKDIKACADSMTEWINTKFKGYYVAAEMDAELAKMRASIDSAKTAGKISDTKADSIAKELTKTKTAVDSAKSNIRSEYKAAIKTAIETSEGKLTKALNDAIDKVNGKIDVLADAVYNLGISVAELERRVEALETMIQSVTIVPAFSDGSVKVEDDTLFIDLSVTPKDIVKTLDTVNFTILLNKVLTKAVKLDTVRLNHPGDTVIKDIAKGMVTIKADIADKLAELDGLDNTSLTVAVNVKVVHSKDLTSDCTTEFVPVSLPVSVSLDKHLIVVPYRTSDSAVTLTPTVKNSTKGVSWTSSNEDLATVNDGTLTIKANVFGKDTIVVKTVEGNATDTCFLTIIPDGFVDLGVVVDGKPLYWAEKNIGATKPEDYGDYFAWGATEPAYSALSSNKFTFKDSRPSSYGDGGWISNSGFAEVNTPYYSGSTYTKYTSQIFTETVLEPSDDAATKKNSGCRTPTMDEFVALVASCVWEWTDNYNSTSKSGYIVYKAKNEDDKGKLHTKNSWKKWNGASYQGDSQATETYSSSDTHIFFPAAGSGKNLENKTVGKGYYYSRTLTYNVTINAYCLFFNGSNVDPTSFLARYQGTTIRPVAD